MVVTPKMLFPKGDDKKSFDFNLLTTAYLTGYLSRVNTDPQLYTSDIRIHTTATIPTQLNNAHYLSLMKSGNRILDIMLYAISSKETREEITVKDDDGDAQYDGESVSQLSTLVFYSLMVFIISDQTDPSTPEGRIPKIITKAYPMIKLEVLNDKISMIKNLRPVFTNFYKRMPFSGLSIAFSSRLKLGFAGHRYIVAYAKFAVTIPDKLEALDDDNKKFSAFLLKLDNLKPLRALHSCVAKDFKNLSSMNKTILAFVSFNELCTIEHFRTEVLGVEHRGELKFTKIELKSSMSAFMEDEKRITGTSLLKELNNEPVDK